MEEEAMHMNQSREGHMGGLGERKEGEKYS